MCYNLFFKRYLNKLSEYFAKTNHKIITFAVQIPIAENQAANQSFVT